MLAKTLVPRIVALDLIQGQVFATQTTLRILKEVSLYPQSQSVCELAFGPIHIRL